MDEAYVVEGLFVLINTWGEDSHLRRPTPDERVLLDAFFASPRSRNNDGTIQFMYGDELPGIDGDVLIYVADPLV